MSKQAGKILVIGSSGLIGSRLVQILKKEGHAVRETTSRKDHADVQSDRVYLNLATGENLHGAFEGVERAFLISPPGYADQFSMLLPLIQESKRRGLKKVVLMTAMGANAVETTPFRRAEIELERSGLSYNIIRPNWFLNNFNTFWVQGIKEHSTIGLPAGTAKTSFIDARDVALVASKLLVSDQWNNRDFDLTGPEAYSHSDVAAQLTKDLGRHVQYTSVDADGFKKTLLSWGLPADYVDFMMLIFGFLREGYNERLTDNVELITGKKPYSLADYVKENLSAWK
jgi:uncharacterized protein YbjT (DUF2867 family)